nr:unnamed protein product [Callosobruchus analis]
MLYLEDYLEMIEHLPQELRDRFTDMREMDLTIHNNMDELEKRVKIFFNDCKRYPPDQLPQNIDGEFQAIRKEYYKNLEEADEKVQLASQMYDLVDKYLRRLDSELHKFKCELEADNKGITEVLEKRSLELDTPNNTSSLSSLQQKENRYESVVATLSSSSGGLMGSSLGAAASTGVPYVEKRQAVAATVVPPPLVETRHAVQSAATASAAAAASTMPVTTAPIGYNTGYSLGAGPAIAAAASQAIAATQQASYEAINTGGHGHEFNIGKELAGAAQTAIQAIQQDHANNKKKQKKWSSNTSSSSSATSAVVAPIIPAAQVVVPAPESPSIDVAAQNAEVTDGEWTYDPNEPRYCLCNQVSYGDMVACDNEDCPSEWFHYPCVGITAPPKGKWYCPQCTATMKRRRKN